MTDFRPYAWARPHKALAATPLILMLLTAALLSSQPPQRPLEWAQPIQLEGVPNLHKISDSLYRSAQPSAIGMKKLKEMGIKTILNLRAIHSDRNELGDLDLRYERIPMFAWEPKRKSAIRFLQIVTDPERAPVLVHCQHGADRTGTLCAIYRVAIMGWSKEEAIREMTQGGYGFHRIWGNLPKWIRKIHFPILKRDAGLKE